MNVRRSLGKSFETPHPTQIEAKAILNGLLAWESDSHTNVDPYNWGLSRINIYLLMQLKLTTFGIK
jgi:hypothetical protein